MPDPSIVPEENTLTDSLVWLCSARGGNSYWSRILNGTNKIYDPTLGTCCVSIGQGGQYTLTADIGWLQKQKAKAQKLIIVHEAGHLGLRHIERLFRLIGSITDPAIRMAIHAVFNVAADLAVNDSVIRKEPEFSAKDFFGLLPETMTPPMPLGLSMEGYVELILKNQKATVDRLRQLLENGPGGGGGSSSSGEDESQEGDGESHDPRADDPILPNGMGPSAQQNPDLFKEMAELFDKLTGGNHKQWNECAEKMTADEANSAANEMKRHARRLVKSAHQQTILSRGRVSADIEKLVQSLTGPDQVPWNSLLEDVLASAVGSRIVEEMVMPNIGLLNLDEVEPWPGTSLDFQFNITWMTDTSGSMADAEYARACNCMNNLLAVHKGIHLTYVECDAGLQKELVTDNIQPPEGAEKDKWQTRHGYGGTVYTPFFRRILGIDTPGDWATARPTEPMAKPDLIVIVTDGGVNIVPECFPSLRPECPLIWLITPHMHAVEGMDDIPPDRVINMFEIKGEYD